MGQPLTLSIVLDADNKGLVGNVRVSKKELGELNKMVDNTGDSSQRARNKMGRFEKQTKDVGSTSGKASRSVKSLAGSFGGLKSTLAGLGLGVTLGALASGIDTIQGMESQLKTITGDWSSANIELERLIGFAKQTPYDLNQSVEAFAKLTHLGLNPSERAMKSYGNTASAMNKDLMQMIEAVADASVGEFERLKEFGIKASQQGDKVRFTFQGTTTEINKDAQSIQDYLLALGENQFAGSMDDQMSRLSAKTSNFKMELLQLADALGDAGLTEAFGASIDKGAQLVSVFTDLVRSGEMLDELTIWAQQFDATFDLLLADFGIGRETVDSFANESIDKLGELLDFFWSGMQSLGEILKDFPAHWRTSWHIMNGEAEKGWVNLKAGANKLVSYLDEGWENMAFGAGAAWHWVELNFAKMMDGILSTMSDALNTMADGVASLPYMDDISGSIRTGAMALTSMADAESRVRAEIAKSNSEHEAKLGVIAQVRDAAAQDSQATIAEIDRRIAKVIQERDTMIAASNKMRATAKAKRDQEKKDKEAQAAARAAENKKNNGKSPSVDFQYDDSGMKKLIEDVEKLGSSWSNTGDVIVQAFGSIADNINALTASQQEYIKLEALMGEQRKEIMKIDDLGERQKELKKLGKVEEDMTHQRLSSTLGSFASITGAASQMFDEQSKGREALHKAEQAFTIIEVGLALQKAGANALTAITAAFAAPWPVGFASGAAMIAIMAGLGVFSGSSGTPPPSSEQRQENQGTDTVLGSDDKSASLNNAYDRIEELELDQYAELQKMNASMRDLNSHLTHLAKNLVVHSGRFDSDSYDGFLGTKGRIDTDGFFEKALGWTLFGAPGGGLLDSIIGSFKKTKITLQDSGLTFGNQNLGDMFASGSANLSTYYDLKKKKKKYWGLSSKTTYYTEYGSVNDEVSTEIARIFKDIGTSAMEAVNVLGIDVAHSLESFKINIPRLSLKGLSGEEIQKELEAIFSQQSDMIAQWLAPSMKEYQKVGEGLYDTLIRVAQEQAVFNAGLARTGQALAGVDFESQIAISQSIVEVMGGISAFKSATSAYFTSFFSEAEQFEYQQKQLTAQFDQLGYKIPESTSAFRSLIESLDLTTAQGQWAYASLMRLAPAAADYYEQLEKQAQTAKQLADELKRAEEQKATSIKQLTGDIEETLKQILGGSELSELIAQEQKRMNEQQAAADELYRTEMQRYDRAIAAQHTMMDYLNGLKLGDLSTLTPEQQLAEAKLQFDTLMAAAKSGDLDAANNITGVASSFLTIARDYYASSDAYSNIFVEVNKQLSSLAGVLGNTDKPTETTVDESGELKRLRQQLAEEQAAAEAIKNEQLAHTLAEQLASLAKVKNESVADLISSMSIDVGELSESLNIELNKMIAMLGVDILDLVDTNTPNIAKINAEPGIASPVVLTNPVTPLTDPKLLELISELRLEVQQFRKDNTQIASSAAEQRDEQRQTIVDSGNRTTNALRVPINTRSVA